MYLSSKFIQFEFVEFISSILYSNFYLSIGIEENHSLVRTKKSHFTPQYKVLKPALNSKEPKISSSWGGGEEIQRK